MAAYAAPLKEGTTNYMRFGIGVLHVTTKALRGRFRTIHPNLSTFLTNERARLQYLRSKNIITSPQWDLLYPTTGPASVDDFDSTLLLLLLRNASGVVAPSTGWSCLPLPSDTSLGADLVRIREIRNNYVHGTSMEIPNDDFGTKWTELSQVIARIGGQNFSADLHFYLVRPLDETDAGRTISKEVQQMKLEFENMLPTHIKERGKKLLSKTKEQLSLFVTTKAFEKIRRAIQKNNLLTISGSLGCGKKTLAHNIALWLSKNGYEIIPIYDCQELLQSHNSNKKQLFVVDNPFGRTCLDSVTFSVWCRYHDDILACLESSTTTKAIFTCRTTVLKNENCRKNFTLLHRNVVDISEERYALRPKDITRLTIVYNCKLSLPLHFPLATGYANASFMPLLLRTMMGTRIESTREFEYVPFELFKSELLELVDKHKDHYYALLLVWLSGNSFNPDRDTPTMIANASSKLGVNIEMPSIFVLSLPNLLKEMDGSYLSEVNGTYSFANELFYDLLSYNVSLLAPKFTIEACSRECFVSRIVSSSYCQRRDDVLILREELYEAWFKRFLSEVKNGYFLFLLTSPLFLGMQEYIKKMFAAMPLDELILTISANTCEKLDVVDDAPQDIRSQFESLRSMGNLEAFYGLIAFGTYDLVILMWKRLKGERLPFLTNKLSFLKAVIINGDEDMFDFFSQKLLNNRFSSIPFLRQKGFDTIKSFLSNQSCLCIASMCNHLEMTKRLLDLGLDVNQENEKGESPLYLAAKNGNLAITRLLISHFANVNTRTRDGLSPFMAAIANDRDQAKVLIRLFLDIDELDIHLATKQNETALMIACGCEKSDVVSAIVDFLDEYERKAFVNRRNLNGVSALYKACHCTKYNSKQIVKTLLSASADPNVCDVVQNSFPLHAASLKNNLAVVQLLLQRGSKVNAKDKDGVTAFHIAAENGFIEVSSVLIEHNCDVNTNRLTDGATPLLIAAEKGHFGIVRLILRYDKNSVNIQNKELSTPLLLTTLNNHTKVCDILLEYGADVHISNQNGYNPILVAARNGNIKLLDLCLSKGANINCKSVSEGYTPLHMAAVMGNTRAVTYLLTRGANVEDKDNNNLSPSMIAHLTKQREVAEILYTYILFGAKFNSIMQTPSIKNPRTETSITSYSQNSTNSDRETYWSTKDVSLEKEFSKCKLMDRSFSKESIASSSAGSSVYSDTGSYVSYH